MNTRALLASSLLLAVTAQAAEPGPGSSALLPSASFDSRTPGLEAEIQAAKDRHASGQALMGVGAAGGVLSVLSLVTAGLVVNTAPYAAVAGVGVSVVDSKTGNRMISDADAAVTQAQTLAVVGLISAAASVACVVVGAQLAGTGNQSAEEFEAGLEEQEHLRARVRAADLAALRQRLFSPPPPAETGAPEPATVATTAPPTPSEPPPPPAASRQPLRPRPDAPLRDAP